MTTDFAWIRSIINSCTNKFQIDCCFTLLELFLQKHEGAEGLQMHYNDLLANISDKITLMSLDA